MLLDTLSNGSEKTENVFSPPRVASVIADSHEF